jgi:hypothetical protein
VGCENWGPGISWLWDLGKAWAPQWDVLSGLFSSLQWGPGFLPGVGSHLPLPRLHQLLGTRSPTPQQAPAAPSPLLGRVSSR